MLIYLIVKSTWVSIIIIPIVIVILAYSLTMLRFWRTPKRKIISDSDAIVSPADGNIIYIKKLEAYETPLSIKKKLISNIHEITKTDLLNVPCWLIGINMTPFDVHKNCSPIEGKIIMNKHFDGKFLSLKDPESVSVNERNTYVIKSPFITVGVIQIASKRVRRIDSYVKEGDNVNKGQWLGMIRFGSQVDVILPYNCKILVKEKEQVYAGTTILGRTN